MIWPVPLTPGHQPTDGAEAQEAQAHTQAIGELQGLADVLARRSPA